MGGGGAKSLGIITVSSRGFTTLAAGEGDPLKVTRQNGNAKFAGRVR
jgi:hypothetical protein